MKKKTIITILLAFVAMTGLTKEKAIVWEQPTMEFGNNMGDLFFSYVLDMPKVELKDNETVVYITTQEQWNQIGPDKWYQVLGADNTQLKVDSLHYALVSADSIKLNKHLQTNNVVAFHFPPLPKGTKSFDFVGGNGQDSFHIKDIKPVEERWKQLFPSYWRDNNGDWKIAFFDDCAIYDCKFWNYKQCDVNPKTGEATILMTNGNDELKVVIGKNKKGLRTFQIGSEKATYAMITTRFLPDYPTKDTRTDFVDTGYKMDTVTVVGWIKNTPDNFKQTKTFDFKYMNICTEKQETIHANLDKQGRFTVKIPLLNSTEFSTDCEFCSIHAMFEPGKTYFILNDFKEGRHYFMGDDCRLQNELIKYHADRHSLRMDFGDTDFDKYIVSVDSLIKAQNAAIDQLCEAHPTLSTRFNIFRKGNILMNQAWDFGQSRFRSPNRQLPDNARQYAYDNFWTKMEKPYTLHRGLSYFLSDYLEDATKARNAEFSYSPSDNYKDFASNDEELALLTRWKTGSLNDDLEKEVDKILDSPRASKIINGGLLVNTLKQYLLTLDSLHADPFIKDIWLTRQTFEDFNYDRTSLAPNIVDTLKTMISNPAYIAMIEKQNDYYLAIENREFDKLVIKSSDNLADLSEGEALLKKILEPYKGKFVLLDIWGTWCTPCKEALSHSTEEFARLKDYDIQFLYLANSSPEESWKNVIKEYNVSGPNVAHYNLPYEQQSAIERHLEVKGFPTYKLFNRNGELLNLNVDPRDLDALAKLLESMK